MEKYCKRLIEVDLPIKRISAHARREKSIRHGHISTLHIWWARRPLAACRAVICASLWPDPADDHCPKAFLLTAKNLMLEWTSHERQSLLSVESRPRFESARKSRNLFDDPVELRDALLDFIADFANWDNSTVKEYRETSRALTQVAHEALGGALGTRPLVVDPFAGGGSIPLEALRVGADTFASDLNPIPVLLNKVVLEYIPKYGQRLADEVRKWGAWIKQEAEKELAEFYPKDPDGATPIAYLWARTIKCEGPSCGVEVPLIRSLWLAKKGKNSVALKIIPHPRAKRVDFEVVEKATANDVGKGTVARGSATCPCCGYTTAVSSVREQLKIQHGGANYARLLCVVRMQQGIQGRSYRVASDRDLIPIKQARLQIHQLRHARTTGLHPIPGELLDTRGIRHTWAMIYGIESWDSCFMDRQLLALTTLVRILSTVKLSDDRAWAQAVRSCLALAVSRQTDYTSSLCTWVLTGEFIGHTFARQALPMVWDFTEVAPFANGSGNFDGAIDWIARVILSNQISEGVATVAQSSATKHPLPSDSADGFVTDPPYYDSVPYAYLSDYFYVWLKRMLSKEFPDIFHGDVVPKDEEVVVDRKHELSTSTHDIAFYERELTKSFAEGRRVLKPGGIGVIVFASKTTSSWEAILQAVLDAGWIITASWPIDTEMAAKVAGIGQARLMSSIHIVVRPRENTDGSIRTDEVGEWQPDVLAELPKRIHNWMPRLAEEGVVGADAIFACLGPALEIFSRYSRVEKASGEAVTLKEYLEQVWAAVSKEALKMIFEGADASGFEEDARLTAMWLWTLATGDQKSEEESSSAKATEDEEDEDSGKAKKKTMGGFALEYDAARKIAQGLGAHLENLEHLVELQGETAILLPVAARTRYLFGKDSAEAPKGRAKKKDSQLTLSFEGELKAIEKESKDWTGELKGKAGQTILDQLHQSMILFAASRGEALKRFLVEDGIGKNAMFWRLAQAFSALYPSGTDEKRWVDGVLARKKGLGF